MKGRIERQRARQLHILWVLIMSLTTVGLWANENQKVSANPVDKGAVAVDGRLDEAIWQTAQPLGGLVQEEPYNGQPASEDTEVRFLYSDTMLYVGIIARDSEPQKISRRLRRRDEEFNSDWVAVCLDPNLDRRTGYEFRINPAGVEVDLILYDDTKRDASWDAVWDSAAVVQQDGWTAELAIPFSQLRLPRASGSTWGVNVERAVDRKSERSFWIHNPHGVSGRVSRFGRLTGIANIAGNRRLEVVPYTLARADRLQQGDSEDYEIGADMSYRLGKSFQLDATFNPDFGQVEADPSVLNLTAFETFFPEKRAFFLEGSEIFRTRFNQFFSRRIGGEPRYLAGRPHEGTVTEQPEQTRILGALKLTGKTERGATIGLVAASTRNEYAQLQLDDGSSDRTLLEPESQFMAARYKQDINQGNGYVGGMLTGVLRNGYDDAYTSAIDFENYFFDRHWLASGNAISSRRGEGEERAEGFGVDMALRGVYRYWDYELDLDYYDDKLDLNDLGYLRRNDVEEIAGGFSRKMPDPKGPFLSQVYTLNVGRQGNTDGYALDEWIWTNAALELRNHWNLDFTFTYFFSGYYDRETRGGPLVAFPAGYWGSATVTTDGSRNVTGSLGYSFVNNDGGGNSRTIEAGLDYLVVPALQLSLAATYEKEADTSQWVRNLVDAEDPNLTHYLYGHLDSELMDLTLRMNWTFSPNMTFQLYTQAFLVSGDYENFRELAEPGTDRYTAYAYEQDEDFDIGDLTVNAVFRWEYAPGSQIFLIWNEGRQTYEQEGRLRPNDHLSDLLSAPADDVFLLKISKWFNR